MNQIVSELRKTGIFYIATSDGERACVRPFSSLAEINHKLFLCTANYKDCYRQLQQNPSLEIAGMLRDGSWLRIRGKAVFTDDREIKRKMLEDPSVPPKYSLDDGVFEVYSVEDMIAEKYLETGEKIPVLSE